MILRLLKGGYSRVRGALSKTRSLLGDRVRSLLGKKLDEDVLEELEEIFYEADLGVKTTMSLVEEVRELFETKKERTAEEALAHIRSHLTGILTQQPQELNSSTDSKYPTVLLIVGANGNGKTTSIAKLTKRLHKEGKSVLLVAGDTFRAAAVEQLELWAQKLGVDIVRGKLNADPSAVVFDALTSAMSRGHDVVVIDTAGRLHTKAPLMQELNKIKRTCQKVVPDSPHETLLVLDTSIGQNAIDQAKVFNEYTPITGLILTKLDGTAKGGIVVSIQRDLGIPVKFIGLGEGVDDLQPFDAQQFVTALFDE